MDTESACLIFGLLLYAMWALWNGLRMSVEDAHRFWRVNCFVCVALVLSSIPLAIDSLWSFLPTPIGIALVLVLGFAAMLAIYAVFLGLVLVFRRAYRQLATRLVGVSAVSLLLGFCILYIVGIGKPSAGANLAPRWCAWLVSSA